MSKIEPVDIASKCHDIQTCMGNVNAPEYESIPEIGMLVKLALHIRGLPQIPYETLKLVAQHYLNIPSYTIKQLLNTLAEIEFVSLYTEGGTYKSVLPKVPYFDDIYEGIGEFAVTERDFNEPEMVALEILSKLYESPVHKSTLFELGTEKKVIDRSLHIGKSCGYVIEKVTQGKNIILSPVSFSENAELYANLVAKQGAKKVKRVLDLVKQYQGWPLSIIEESCRIGQIDITIEEIELLKALATDGAVKPPSITTSHHGNNYFMFTPTPNDVRIHASKREIYERAMAVVAAVRQGQLLPRQYAIRSPKRLLESLKEKGFLRANTEAFEQYRNLAVMRLGYLEKSSGDWYTFRLSESEENVEALDIAIQLVGSGELKGMEVNEDAQRALLQDQSYIESIISTAELRKSETIALTEEQQLEIDLMLLGGVK